MNSRDPVLGVEIFRGRKADAANAISSWWRERFDGAKVVITLNVFTLFSMSSNFRVRRAILSADLVVADGAPIVWLLRVFGRPVRERIAGIDLMNQLLEEAELEGRSVYLLGTSHTRLQTFCSVVRIRFPRLLIAGSQDGYFGPDETSLVVDRIKDSGAALLLVAMPTPFKETWVQEQRNHFTSMVVMGVGGAFDVEGGYLARAPEFLRNHGLEWLWRLWLEPKRLAPRYFRSGLWLLLHVARLALDSILRRLI